MLLSSHDYQRYVAECTPHYTRDRKKARYREQAVGHALDAIMGEDATYIDAVVYDGRELKTTRQLAQERLQREVAKRMGFGGLWALLPFLWPILWPVIQQVVELILGYLFKTPEAAKMLRASRASRTSSQPA